MERRARRRVSVRRAVAVHGAPGAARRACPRLLPATEMRRPLLARAAVGCHAGMQAWGQTCQSRAARRAGRSRARQARARTSTVRCLLSARCSGAPPCFARARAAAASAAASVTYSPA